MYKSIAISGQIAAGSSTAAKALAERLNLEYHSAGDFFRQYMLQHNIPLYDKSQIPDELDRKIDRKLIQLADHGGAVIDADYIGYFTRNMLHVLKVLLTCNEEEKIRRAVSRVHTHKETAEEVNKRQEELYKKFHKIYSAEDYLNPKFFDLVIDTTRTGPEKVVEQILKKFRGN
ncbi:hypothetical protein A2697_04145 [Candidatus Curtissbacteria bacterium RIFCSPHIGHO2_01_FULL_41_44]|uniref:(d)CMP kinase n=1 Tax=Candidatus Curtissbacteria bacterium RIFCSPLOWO2_01_FULL_42_50 TaxID=1797730 RepID=A0A1F5H2Y8_9BACT|nr:MAG: hypothetical protein A3C33_04085 [Candidatus Curtissbacteria bacterium RIFCSPHIGHO2_02_FULL_42_58]OGD93754.1 MAG: hypothetical protein A2697_04145 [Candidatus Curtissbacteria bacterium RIFCSPHIGHO2_01_FULL_41_44]OGD97252.1 MAG: hypothetical protein A3E71_04295 [Candidatus Curtissbacteria bacterium RIFCSPHIGHO2_12_FULL_42_33]OGD98424.1 MAG: hypothetical protein A3B54_03755 [Candidatus Curtissbacteria bacterium RIFCSPLOWO2_01_FULL_42_50]OGE02341.1 MAG: hypothetical protein A3G16_03890 [Ca